MSYKIYKNGEWIECAGQQDVSNLATKQELQQGLATREAVGVCYYDAEQSGNKLTLKKSNGVSFDYEPEIPSAMTFKGSCLQANLPTSEQQVGDYWKLSDTTGQYVGQCAIWDGTQWTYSSSNINIEQTLQTTSTQAVSGKAVFDYLQQFYNALYPIGCAYFGITAPVVPNGITATWQLESSPNGCAVWVDSNKTPGTVEMESATIAGTAITEEQMPSHKHDMWHKHDRGDMNITGTFAPVCTDRNNWSAVTHNGCFTTSSLWGNDGPTGLNGARAWLNFNAASNWYGLTGVPRDDAGNYKVTGNAGGGQTHTHTISNIKPNRVFIKVWIRSA